MKVSGVGHICLWQGGSLFIGRATGATDAHAHHAVQISVALEGTCRFREPSRPWIDGTRFIVPMHQPHAYDGQGAIAAQIFVEPESLEGRSLQERYGAGGIVQVREPALDAAVAALAACYRDTPACPQLVPAAWNIIHALTSGIVPRTTVDERVLKAIALLRERIGGPIPQEEIAEAVFLSPGRFRHLFVQETGMPFRPFVLWLRLERVLHGMAAGESLTQASLEAGFADSAHMSRTFRRMFGLAPTMLRRAD